MSKIIRQGFTLIEILLAIAIFGLISTTIIAALLYGQQSVRLSGDRMRASQLSSEGIEAVRNIANPNYSNLAVFTNGTTYYLVVTANQWQLTTTPSVIDGIYTRTVVFADGPNGTRKITVRVSWQQVNHNPGELNTVTYLANWRQTTAAENKAGLIIYADGGTTTDRTAYRLLQLDGTWTAEAAMPDFDSSSTNRVARSIKLYSAQSGSTKMAISRHFNGTTQFVYATVWNGSTWNTPQLLGQFNSTASLNVGNYGGDFLANGTFVAVYSDNTNVPKYRTYNGISWSAQGSLPAMGSSSNRIVNMSVEARPNANEAMTAILGSNSDIESSFFANNAWSDYTQHTTVSVSSTSKIVDFAWSPVDNTKGLIIYTANPNDRSMRARTFTADNNGSGSWQPVANSTNQPPGSIIHSLGIAPRHSNFAEFVACDKDDQATPDIYCYKLIPGPDGLSDTTNGQITTNTDPGGQRSFDLDYLYLNDSIGLIAYSDNTSSTKLKRFDTASNSWDLNPIVSFPNAPSTIQKTRIVARPNSNDAMVVSADANKNLSSAVFDGNNNIIYTSPVGYGWLTHSANGPSNSAVWFDFAWDN